MARGVGDAGAAKAGVRRARGGVMKRDSVAALGRPDQLYRRLDELCEFAPETAEPEALVFWFVQLVRWLRGTGAEQRGLRLRYFRTHLEQHPSWHDNVSRAFTRLVGLWDFEQLLAYGGIARDFHLGGAVREWLSYRGLPIACNTDDAAAVLNLAFERGDLTWLGESTITALVSSLVDVSERMKLRTACEDALIDLANQLVAQAQAPSIRNLSEVERSPFRGVNRAVEQFLEHPASERTPEGLQGRIRQCVLLLETHKRQLALRGADLNTTFQLDRMSQQLERAALLVSVLAGTEPNRFGRACVSIVRAVTRNASGRRLVARSSELVLENLVDTAASVGRDYLDDEKSSWRAAFTAGAGGGALMACATLIKYQLARLQLPTFYEGVLYSLNYASIFCAAYLLHFTIATKLPAHTAAALAKSVQEDEGHRQRLRHFLEIWRAMVRLQLAGLLGNVLFAGPVGYVFDLAAKAVLGRHLLDEHTALHVMSSNSVLGPSVLYAALTGCFLWLSSLAGAAGDNWARVTRMVDRLSTNLSVMRRIGSQRARPVAEFWVARFGGLLSNTALGFMLGGVPAAFAIVQLPIEIRHVTVSTSSFAMALATGVGTSAQIWLATIGVMLIGAVNVSVSFALALQLALSTNARRRHGSARALVSIAIERWLRRRTAEATTPSRLEPPRSALQSKSGA
jgi:site-specific recombinase